MPQSISTPVASGSTGLDFNNEDQLYQLSQLSGGAVAEAANEISHPNTGILSSIGNGFKNAFKLFVDAISIPSEIVSGVISDKYTVGQAIDQHISIDKALFGDSNIFGGTGNQTTMEKVGGFIVRAAPDILLDPVTWLSFGAGSLSKVAVVSKAGKEAQLLVAGEIAAQGLKGADAIAYQSSRMSELEHASAVPFSQDVTMTTHGQDTLSRYAKTIQTGNANTFMKEEAIKLVNQSVDEFGKPTLSLNEALDKVKVNLDTFKYDEAILKKTIDAPLDMERAKAAMGNLLARRPGFMETMVDKGGIKFLGRTLLEGQRIESAIKMIPMMHTIETMTQPIREGIFGLSKTGKEYSTIERKFADIAKSRKNDAILGIVKTIQENKLTAVEADFVTAAIEAGKMPTDPKLKDIYLSSLGVDPEIASSLLNNQRITNTIREFSRINKVNYRQAIDAGIPLSKKDNYMMHLTDMKDVQRSYSNISPVVNLKNAKFAEVQKFDSIIKGGETVIGKAQSVLGGLERYDPELQAKVFNESMTKLTEKYGIKLEDLHTSTIDMQTKIQETFAKMTEKDFVNLVQQSIPGAKGDYIEAAARAMKENIPNLDFRALKDARIKALSEAETGVGQLLKSSPDKIKAQIAKIFDSAQQAKQQLPGFAEQVTGAMAGKLDSTKFLLHGDITNIEKGLVSTTENGVIDAEARAFIKQLKDAKKSYETKLASSNINEKVMADYMDKMVTEFNQNPVGVKHMIDSLIGKESKLHELLNELSDRKFALMKQMDTNGELAMMDSKLYRSKAGEIFRASRPTVIEANAAGFHFQQNALPLMVHSSINTVKATVSKDFISEIATKFGKLESEAPAGFREVNVSGLKDSPGNLSNWLTGKNGEKIVFHPEVAKRIEQFNKSVINDEDINKILEQFDKVTSIFKASVTSIFPSFHGRNAISNVLNSFLDIGYSAVNPARHVMASHIVASSYRSNAIKTDILKGVAGAEAKLYNELSMEAFTDKRGYTWSVGQIHQILKDRNIALGNQFAGRIDVDRHVSADMLPQLMEKLFPTEQSLLKKGSKLPGQAISGAFSAGQKVGQTIEDHARIIHFLEHLDRTGDVQLAAERTKMFLFDYGDLSNFERTFMKRIIPFYTWIKKNVELQTKVLLTTPGRISQQVHMFNTLSSVMSNGHGLTDEEYNQLPDYMKNQFNLVTSRDGNKLHVMSNLGSPLEAAFNAIQGRSMLGAVNPLVQLPAELITGFDVFRGGMMADTNNASLLKDAPQSVKDLVGFVHYKYKDTKTGEMKDRYSALNPKMFFFIMNQPFGSRIFQQYLHEKTQIKAGTATSLQEDIKNVTGIQNNALDLEAITAQAQKKRVQEFQYNLEKAGILGKMQKDFKSKTTIPAE